MHPALILRRLLPPQIEFVAAVFVITTGYECACFTRAPAGLAGLDGSQDPDMRRLESHRKMGVICVIKNMKRLGCNDRR